MSASTAPAAPERFLTIEHGDSLDVLRELEDGSVDSIVTDPPYGMSAPPDMVEVLTHWLAGESYEHKSNGFMGKAWDSFVPGPEYWRECFRVLKPGGHLAAFASTRTYDLMALAIRLGGFEIRDMLSWVYGTGFPKSLDVSKAIDKAAEREVTGVNPRAAQQTPKRGTSTLGDFAGAASMLTAPSTDAAKQWSGFGTALKPACEPVVLARKPLVGTVAANVLTHGTGALNIDGCRIGTDSVGWGGGGRGAGDGSTWSVEDGTCGLRAGDPRPVAGRWPANVLLDEDAAAILDEQSGTLKTNAGHVQKTHASVGYRGGGQGSERSITASTGGASRFFYVAKASKRERSEGLPKDKKNEHPTVKPIALMRWLARLITPPGGLVLDPFAGSGTTGCACAAEGFDFLGIEREAEYVEIATARLARAVEEAS